MAKNKDEKVDEKKLKALDEVKLNPGDLATKKYKKYSKDRGFVLLAIEVEPKVYRYVSSSLKKDSDFRAAAIKKNADVLEQMGFKEESIEDKDVARYFLSLNEKTKKYISEKVLKALEIHPIKPILQRKKKETAVQTATVKQETNKQEIEKSAQQKFEELVKTWILPDAFMKKFNELADAKTANGQTTGVLDTALKETLELSRKRDVLSEEERTAANKKLEELRDLLKSKDVNINAKDIDGHSTVYSVVNYTNNPLVWYILATSKAQTIQVDDDVIKEIASIENKENKYICDAVKEYKAQKEVEAEQKRKQEEAAKVEEQKRLQVELFEALKKQDIAAVKKAVENGADLSEINPFSLDSLSEEFKKAVIELAHPAKTDSQPENKDVEPENGEAQPETEDPESE